MSEQTVPAIEVVLPPPPPKSKYERERDAFRRLLPSLLATHRDKYVAIHEERVVDEDVDPINLIGRVLGRIGSVAIHVDLVTDQVRPPKRISPRLARKEWP